MTSAALASPRQADDESLKNFMDTFGRTAVQIRNLNPEVALHSMLLTLRPDKFVDSLCKKPPSSMDELRERAKGYIQMKEISRFRNQVRQVGQKCDKREGNTKIDIYKSDKRHKPDKCRPLTKRVRYEPYTPLTANHTIILEESSNLEVLIRLPSTKPTRLRLDMTKYYRYHRDQTTTKQEQDLEDTEKSNKGIMMQIEEEIKQKIEVDRDTSNSGTSDKLHNNKNPPSKFEV
ncbi:hypothetical protein JHK85_000502 [Glycine max]|nr:hypothetical protein JHK85_000502 [Glycine max]